MRVFKSEDTKLNMCDFCLHSFNSCPKANHIKFGDGIGNDNVIECSEYITKRLHSAINIAPEYGVIKKGE